MRAFYAANCRGRLASCLLPAAGVANRLSAAETLATIEIPAAKQTLQIVHQLPPAAQAAQIGRAGSGYRRQATVITQLEPAPAADGQPDREAKRLLAAVPPSRRRAGGGRARGDARVFRFESVGDTSLKIFDIFDGEKPVLTYNFGTITRENIPEKEHRRSRACYVHPVWGLNGEVLTDDFPKDHYHHHGVFWAWPHVGIDGQKHNIWAGSTIRQQFERWMHKQAGPVAATLGVENGWYVGDKKVMIERVWMRAFREADDVGRSTSN